MGGMEENGNKGMNRKDSTIIDKCLMAGAIISVLSVIFYVLAFSKWEYHSDCAAFLLLAKEQLAQKCLFPNGFHYTTGIFALAPNITMIPGLLLLKNDLLIHEVGTLLYAGIALLLVLILFKNEKRRALFTIILITIPYSYTYRDMMFQQGAYMTSVIWTILFLVIVKGLLLQKKSDPRVRRIFLWGVYVFCLFLIFWYSISNYLFIGICGAASFVVLLFFKEGGNPFRWKHQNTICMIILSLVLMMGVCGINYKHLCDRLNFDNSVTITSGLIGGQNIWENTGKAIGNILSLYGVSATDSLFGVATVAACGLLVLFIITNIIVPICALLHVNNVDDVFTQFLYLYFPVMSFACFFMMIFCGYNIDRYFIPAQVLSFLVTACFMDSIIDKYNFYTWDWLTILLLCLSLMCHLRYYVTIPRMWYENLSAEEIVNPTVQSEAVKLLQANGLKYGFATFWHAYSEMAYANSEIMIVAHDMGNPRMPYYFDNNNGKNYYAVSESWYDPELHPGRCFVLVYDGEVIPDSYFQVANETIRGSNFTILVFEKNIYSYEELDVSLGEYITNIIEYRFEPKLQSLERGVFTPGTDLVLSAGAEQPLNFVDLASGEFVLTICGDENISNLSVEIQNVINNVPIEITKLQSDFPDTIAFSFYIEQKSKGNQIILKNKTNDLIDVHSITLS